MSTPPGDRELEAIATLREPTRQRLYRYVERQPRAVSRDEVAEAAGVSRALATFHLEKLVRVGLLNAEYRRLSGRSGPGAGRTSKLYRRSRHRFDISLPHRDTELLARLLAESLNSARADSPDVTRDVAPAHEYGRALGSRARRRLRAPAKAERMIRCIEDVLESVGFEPYRATSGEIRLRNCPFSPLSSVFTGVVCGVGQSVLQGVVDGVGADHVRVGREEQPDRCCGVLAIRESRSGHDAALR